jgi:hypothetical protein
MSPALLLLVLATPPRGGSGDGLASDDVATRTRAAVAWSRTHAPVALPRPRGDAAPAEAHGCVSVRPPRETGCTRAVWACPVETESGSCSGAFSSTEGVVFADGDGPPPHAPAGPTLLLEARSGDDAPELECAAPSGFAVAGAVTPEEAARRRAAWEAEQARAYARCVEATRRRQAAEETRLSCQVLLVNPCRREAFVLCRGLNLDRAEGLPAAGLRRFTW